MDGAYHLGEPVMHWSRSLAIVLVLLGLAPVLAAIAQRYDGDILPSSLSRDKAPATDAAAPTSSPIPPIPEAARPAPMAVVQLPETVPPARRDVTPPGMTPGPQGDGPLTREPAPPRPAEPPQWRRFELPDTANATTFQIDGKTIRIAGVIAPKPEETCKRQNGGDWPCGRTALHSFRLFLGGRPIECFFPYADTAVEITAPCRVGKVDLGLWLLKTGWAKPGAYATEEYLKASESAHCNRRGLWRGEVTVPACPAARSG
jgi:endonuclease YncB( thermonuclease family)